MGECKWGECKWYMGERCGLVSWVSVRINEWLGGRWEHG